MISQLIFSAMAILAITLFSFNILKVISNIKIGSKVNRSDQPWKRFYTMLRVALGQSKMNVRLVPAALHLVVYVGFIVVNIEVLEIILDGVLGKHRIFGGLGPAYNFLIATFEVFALLVWVACVVFLIRRNFLKISRFFGAGIERVASRGCQCDTDLRNFAHECLFDHECSRS